MTARKGQGFPKTARIRSRKEFLSLGRTGDKRRTAHFVLVSRPCAAVPRLGITVSRKVGGAVTRNRLKRRIREMFRRHPDRARFESDVIVIAKVGAGALTSQKLQRECLAAMGRRPSSTSNRPATDRR
jgi:ribonuclease P protein component